MTYDQKAKRTRTARKLTVHMIKNAKPGLYADAAMPTLNLLVTDTGARRFIQRITIRQNGKQTMLGLGGWPVVTLEEAREAALDNRRLVRKGIDPRTSQSPALAQGLEAVLKIRRSSWSDKEESERQWRSSMRDYAGAIMDRPVNAIVAGDVLKVVEKDWEVKRETMRRVLSRLSIIFDWAVTKGYRSENPCDAILAVLPKNGASKKHHAAMPHAEVGAALAKMRGVDTSLTALLAFEFLILSASRSGEVRFAKWSEIDEGRKIWTIPGERMKGKKMHRVPLCARALAILEEARPLSGGSDLLFPGARRGALGDMTFNRILEKIGAKVTTHGFRSSFRDWCAETNKPQELAEAALAHTVPGVEGAYFRSDLFDARRKLMEDWQHYLIK